MTEKPTFKIGDKVTFVFEASRPDKYGNLCLTSTLLQGKIVGFHGVNLAIETKSNWRQYSVYIMQPDTVVRNEPGCLIKYLRAQYSFLRKP